MPTTPTQHPHRHNPTRRPGFSPAPTIWMVLLLAAVFLTVLAPSTAHASTAGVADPPQGYEESVDAQETLIAVINNIRNVVMGLLAGLATLLLTIAGVRYLASSGDPSETEKAKAGLKAAAIGYGLAVLAPVIAALLTYVVTFR